MCIGIFRTERSACRAIAWELKNINLQDELIYSYASKFRAEDLGVGAVELSMQHAMLH
jgi:hypothetical protein